MTKMIHSLNNVYDYIENTCQDIKHPKVVAMLEAVDNAITIIENAQRINDKLSALLTSNEIV